MYIEFWAGFLVGIVFNSLITFAIAAWWVRTRGAFIVGPNERKEGR